MRTLHWLVVAVFFRVAFSASAPGQFFNPPPSGADGDYSDNPVYAVGDVISIKWTTSLQNYYINIRHQSLTSAPGVLGPALYTVSAGGVTQIDWAVQLYQFDLSDSNVFFFWLSSPSSGSFDSHYFNITARASTSTTSTPSSSTTSTSSLTPTGSSTTSPTPPIPATTAPASGGLSAGAQAGIGVGAALAGLAAIIVAIVFYLRSRKRPTDQPPNRAELPNHGVGPMTQGAQYPEYTPQIGYTPQSVSEYTSHSEYTPHGAYKTQGPIAEMGQ
ncbi:hypothetical protein F4777DRAFT_561635 [Nemania sp. FL0916]|nr:hypothetical protein F4777DRAFT_561635 [Nemania sp. FL0916]